MIVVPNWKNFYVYSVDDLYLANDEQRDFYCFFKAEFKNGRYLDLQGNSNYAFLLMFDICNECKSVEDFSTKYDLLRILGLKYPKTASYAKRKLNLDIRYKEKRYSYWYDGNINKDYKHAYKQECLWIPRGKEVNVQGLKLKLGNFYLGQEFLLPKEYRDEFIMNYEMDPFMDAFVVNPSVVIDEEKVELNMYSSYLMMDAYWRGQYLQWLSGEVKLEDVSVEILYLYLYGLSVRIFLDGGTSDEEREFLFKKIISYKHFFENKSFCNVDSLIYYLNHLIDSIGLKYFRNDIKSFLTDKDLKDCKMLTKYEVISYFESLGVLKAEKSAEVFTYLNGTGYFCSERYEGDVKKKFEQVFLENYPDGCSIDWQDYSDYTSCYDVENFSAFCIDQKVISCELFKLNFNFYGIKYSIKSVTREVQKYFSEYRRYVEKIDGSDSLMSLSLLPDFINIEKEEKVITLRKYFDGIFCNKSFAVITVANLLEKIDYVRGDEKNLGKKNNELVKNCLRKFGYRVMPDHDAVKKNFNFKDECVLFKEQGNKKVCVTENFRRLLLFIRLAHKVIYGDGSIEDDRAFIYKYIDTKTQSKINRKYLYAFFEWLNISKPKAYSKMKVEASTLFDAEQSQEICDVLLDFCYSNGEVNSNRVERLKKIFPLFGAEIDNIHSQIHGRIVEQKVGFGTSKSKSVSVSSNAFSIDTKKLKSIENDTIKSQSLLSNIFEDGEEEDIQEVLPKDVPQIDPIKKILLILLTKEIWQRKEVEAICKENGQMIGSVLENINDYSYDKIDDSVIDEDDDVINVAVEYKNELI